jgi:hypothetical protein
MKTVEALLAWLYSASVREDFLGPADIRPRQSSVCPRNDNRYNRQARRFSHPTPVDSVDQEAPQGTLVGFRQRDLSAETCRTEGSRKVWHQTMRCDSPGHHRRSATLEMDILPYDTLVKLCFDI